MDSHRDVRLTEKNKMDCFSTGSSCNENKIVVLTFKMWYNSVSEDKRIAEREVSSVTGLLFHRKDIGSDEYVQERIDYINELRC